MPIFYMSRDKKQGYDKDRDARYMLWAHRPKRINSSIHTHPLTHGDVMWGAKYAIGNAIFSDSERIRLGLPAIPPGKCIAVQGDFKVIETDVQIRKRKKTMESMSPTAILKANKMLALFEGAESKDVIYPSRKDEMQFNFAHIEDNMFENLWHHEDELSYHDDWNWLWRIINIMFDIPEVSLNINLNSCTVIFGIEPIIVKDCCETKIEAVYTAVVEFVAWWVNVHNKGEVKNG